MSNYISIFVKDFTFHRLSKIRFWDGILLILPTEEFAPTTRREGTTAVQC